MAKVSVQLTLISLIAALLSGCASANIINDQDIREGAASPDKVITGQALEKFIRSNPRLSAQACAPFVSATETEISGLQKRVKQLEKLVGGSARKAKKFITTTQWKTRIPADDYREELLPERDASFLKPFVETQMAAFKTKSGKVFDRQAIAVHESSFLKTIAQEWLSKYCVFDFQLNHEYNQLARQYNQNFASLSALADSLPWYPNGYSVWQKDSNLAWKWENGATCNLGDSCWHISVVAESQCSSLYAEISIADSSGTDIDWTNDSAPVVIPGKPVLLEFDTYNPDADTGSLVTLNCY